MERRSFSMDEVVEYCNQYGFIFQGSEIYGGLANTWDYGPLGTRLKNLIQDYDENVNADAMTQEEMLSFIRERQVPCPVCGRSNFTDIRQFNLMFETKRGVTDDSSSRIFLRPENAQGEYVNYLNVMRSMRAKLPFSIGQIGKAFRNEITPKNFTFRTIEFEQMEFQTFCKEGDDSELYQYF